MADPISWAVVAYTSVKGAFVMAASSAAFAMGASAATSLTVGAAAASAFKFAGITALSIAANALFAPSVGASGSPTEWRADANAGLPFVAGRLGVAGNLIYSKEFGADNRYLGNVTIYSRAGPVHSMGPFYADGVNITFGSGGVATNGGNIANNMWLSSQDGLQPQPTALPLPGALSSETFTGWTANHKLSGCAADLQVLRQDSKFKTYPSGQPRRYRVIEGIRVYDPRLDSTFPGGDGACRLNDRATYVYTTNAIIHALNWAIGYYENGKPVGGLADPAGPTLDGIDVEAFIAAANIADANAWTGLGARYSTADEKHQVLLGFLQAGGALYAENAGRISCVSRGAVKTSVMTLTRADTAGPVTIDAMPPKRVVINSIIPRCVQESYQWEPVDLEPVTVGAFVTADGGVRRRNKDFPFVTSSVQASQLAALDILDAREPLSGSTTFKPYVRDLKPGDAFTWSEPGFLLNGVKCVVMERSYDPASDTVEITWRSETDSKIAFALGLDPTPPVFPSVAPANPSFVPVPSTDDWGVNGGSIGDDGGPRGPVITIEADPADLTDVTHILVDVRESGETEWTHHGEFPLAGFRRENIFGLLPDTTYDVRLRYRNAFGVVDDEQATIFLNITTGPQVVQSAIGAAPGSALATAIANAQAALGDVAERVDDQERLAETLMDDALTAREASVNRAAAARRLTEQEIGSALDALNGVLDIDATRLADALGAFAGEFITFEQSVDGQIQSRATITQLNAAVASEADARAVALNQLSVNFSAQLGSQQSQINSRATVTQLNQAIANEQQARSSAVGGLRAEFEGEFAALASITFVNEAIADETSARTTAISGLQAQINALDPDGDIDLSGFASITFVNQAVADIYGSSVSQFTQLAAQFSAQQADIDSRATVTQLNQAVANIYGSSVSQFTEINAQFSAQQGAINNRATITQLNQTIADEQGARATADQTIRVEFEAGDASLQTQVNARATITFVNEAVASIYGSSVSQFSQIAAQFSSQQAAIDSRATITQLNQAVADIYGASVSQFTQLDAQFSSQQAAINSRATVTYVDTAVANETSARVSSFANLQAQINALDPDGDIDLSGFASITFVNEAVATLEGSFASTLAQIEVQFSSQQSDINNRATITQLNQAVANIYGSSVSQFSQIEARFGTTDSAISSRATITQLNQAVSDVLGASVSQFSQIEARFGTTDSAISSRATITQLNQAVSDVLGASVSQFSQIEAQFNAQQGDINNRATVTQLSNVVATLEERTAAFLLQATAGAASAGLTLFARDADGEQVSDIRLAAQVIGFGPDFNTPRFVIDMVGGEVYGINANGAVKTFQLSLDTGRLRLRSATGVLVFDSDLGGIQVDGLPNALFTQGPAETTARIGTGVLDTSWVTVAEVNLNDLPDGGRFVCDFACNVSTRIETTAFQPASGEVRIIAVQGATTEQIGAAATWAQDYTIILAEDDGPTLYRATTPPVQSTRVKVQPFSGNVIFRMQARRTDAFGAGAAATVGSVYLSSRRTP